MTSKRITAKAIKNTSYSSFLMRATLATLLLLSLLLLLPLGK